MSGTPKPPRRSRGPSNPLRPILTQLVDAKDSVLLVVDVQDHFLNKNDAVVAARVVERVRWLVQVAQWLKIPVIGTAEDSGKLGTTTEQIRSKFPAGAPEFNKIVFGLAGQLDILQALNACDRQTAILVGLETDVCVLQSALGLLQEGYKVVVVEDATASPETGHQYGLDRMRTAGVALLSSKGLFYEWMRDLQALHQFSSESGVVPPTDLIL